MNLSTTFKGTLSILIFAGTWLVPGFGWNITVFFRLNVSPNQRAALAEESVILFILLIECAMSAQSSANNRSRTRSSVVLVLAFNYYGARGMAEKWVETYLNDRKQFVKIGESSSNLLNVWCFVPQGSVLGPKLFILYINDICNVSKLLKFFLFADGTNILYSDTDVHSLISVVNCELDKLYTWFNVNKLSLNVSKTNYMVFGSRRINQDLDRQIHNDQITRVSKTKFLGVLIDEKLTWKDQINNVKTNLSRITGVMYRASHVLGTTGLPYITHCSYLYCATAVKFGEMRVLLIYTVSQWYKKGGQTDFENVFNNV